MPAKKGGSAQPTLERRASDVKRRPEPASHVPVTQAALPEVAPSLTGCLPSAIVGVGASAGGLEALEAFLAAMPKNPGVAIVIVAHQHPNHTSLLPELLAKKCRLAVLPAANGCLLQADHVYVSLPGKDVSLCRGRLELVDRARDGTLQLPIDHFFRSLAQDQEERAICVVLSGTGTDGTLGLRAVKGRGGMAMVQDERSAKHPGMPLSAAGTELADFVLPPHEMPARLLAFARASASAGGMAVGGDDALSEALDEVLTLLRRHAGHDFNGYKLHAMLHRIERRMRIHEIPAPHEYVAFLESNPHEVDLLFSDLLINVTSFFRDREVFEKLDAALTERLATRPRDLGLRVWVAGCSTGEEAYSIAILIREIATRQRLELEARVFATDLDQHAIDQARVGWYPAGVVADVGEERLARFFGAEGDGYRIKKEIRELCVFATQDVLRDPPFTKLDIVSCRNVLIYLGDDLQGRLIPMFHYALKPAGLLLLGTSETVGEFDELFKPLDRVCRIYERQAGAPRAPGADWLAHAQRGSPPTPDSIRPSEATGAVFATLEKVLLERFAPPSVIINPSGDIVYILGRTGQYLEPSAGEPRSNLFAMAREGLEPALTIAMGSASGDGREIVQHGVRVQIDGEPLSVALIVRRLDDPEPVRGLFRVSFQPKPEIRSEEAGPGSPQSGRTTNVQSQLDEARRALKDANEALQTHNEELVSMNEELRSTNEALSSSNEELGTSQEELQSLNEELQSVNFELQSKVNELAQANDDMRNLLSSTEVAVLFLDRDLKVQRFSAQAREVVRLIPADVGRPIGDLVSHLRYAALSDDARDVLDTLQPHETEVQTTEGKWRLLRMVPYRTASNQINGVMLTLLDIDRMK
jgi:two-component system CheB/CheR fusion protein